MDDVPATTPSPPPWQDLPPELLRLVILHLPSHAGRVRLSAVCHSWRNGAAPPLPWLLPWVALRDGTYLGLSDGAVHRIIPFFPSQVSRRVSMASNLYLMHSDGRRSSVMNPFSQPQVMHVEPDRFRPHITSHLAAVDNVRKVVVMSDHIITLRKKNPMR